METILLAIVIICDWTERKFSSLMKLPFQNSKRRRLPMSQPFTTEPDLVDRVIAREAANKPLREASTAASMVRDVVSRSIEHGYSDHDPIWGESDRYHSIKKEFLSMASLVWCVFSPFVMGVASLAASQAGLLVGLAATACAVALPALWVAGIIHTVRQDTPSATAQFAFASKRLSSATARLPDGREKTLLQKLSTEAKQAFVCAKAAVLQQRIARSDGPQWWLRMLEARGVSLLDKAGKMFNWDDRKRQKLKAAFNAGRLPRPREYLKPLDELNGQVQEALREGPVRSAASSTTRKHEWLGDQVF
jgi:hypothetical protein